MIPVLYKSTETNFRHYGLGSLTHSISCKVTEEENGMYELKLEYPIFGPKAKDFTHDMIIKAKANDETDYQLFRIVDIDKDTVNRKILITGNHIFFDLADNFVEEVGVIGKTVIQAGNIMFDYCTDPHPFRMRNTDITHTADFAHEMVNPVQAFAGIEGSIIQKYGNGPTIVRDNFNIDVMQNRNISGSTVIEYKKNITGFTEKTSTSNVVTKLYPYAFVSEQADNIGGETQEKKITIEGKYIIHENHDKFPHSKIRAIDFSGENVKTSVDLAREGNKYFTLENTVPKVTYTVQIASIRKSKEYAHLKMVEHMGVGYRVVVRDRRFNIDIKSKVTKMIYNTLKEEAETLEIGNVTTTLAHLEQVKKDELTSMVKRENEKISVFMEDLEKGVNSRINVSANEINSSITQSATLNKLRNGGFKTGNWNNWSNFEYSWSDGGERMYIDSSNEWVPSDVHTIRIGSSRSATGGEFGISQTTTLKQYTTYTLSGYVAGHRCVGGVYVASTDNWSWFGSREWSTNGSGDSYLPQAGKEPAGWKKFSITFNTGSKNTFAVRLKLNYALSGTGYIWFTNIMLNEGTLPLPWVEYMEDMESFRQQTADGFKDVVKTGDVMSIVTQNADKYNIAINGKLKGTNYTFDGDNFSIGSTANGNKAEHNQDRSKWTHSDGSYTQIGVAGLERYISGASKPYHYQMYVVGFTSTSDTSSVAWVQLPNEFKGKKFGAYAVLSDTWEGSWDYGQPWVLQRMVTFVQTDQIDYTNARVPVRGYRTDKNYSTDAYRHQPIAGMLLIIA